MINNSILNIAYTAGYIDGDGCLYIGKTIQKTNNNIVICEFSIQVLSVKKVPLQFFKEQFGGVIRQKADKPGHKTPYTWTLKTNKCFEFAKTIYPFLTDKQKACAIFIELEEYITRNNFRVVDSEIANGRENIINKIREEKHMNDFVTEENINALKEVKPFISVTEANFAYLAGLIDSEGCFRIKKWKPKNKPNYVYTINLEIGNTRYPIFPWLMERFGGHITFIKAKPGKKASATWSISADALSKILKNIVLFLKCKREVCEKLIEFNETIIPNGGDRHSKEFKDLYVRIIARREVIVDEIHKLNSKGVKMDQVPSGCHGQEPVGFPVI